ncbi:MAG TPA: HAD-IB family phosphatase [Thermoplasmata archaeon]|nr:HAD-IB family phosphatase [Thermoplasmata archaeon]
MLRLVALDMDGTLVDVESSWAAIHHHFQDHNADGLREFLAGRIDDHEFIRTDIRIWWRHAPDLSVEDLERILAPVPLMPGAHELVDGVHALGARTVILSGGIDLLAHRIARELGIDLVLANGFRVTSDGRLTGEGIVRVPINGKEKVLEGLQHQLGIAPRETASIGNSEIDVGMFRRSRVGVAFLPADDVVRAAAAHVVTERNLGRALDALRDFPDP